MFYTTLLVYSICTYFFKRCQQNNICFPLTTTYCQGKELIIRVNDSHFSDVYPTKDAQRKIENYLATPTWSLNNLEPFQATFLLKMVNFPCIYHFSPMLHLCLGRQTGDLSSEISLRIFSLGRFICDFSIQGSPR